MLGSIPLVGIVFTWIGNATCHVLSAPPELVVSTAKSLCSGLFGGVCQ